MEGALGHEENGKQRLVSTPWSKDAMTFEEAAEIGTKKVIRDHSTIGVVVITDGSVTGIERGSYIEAEERVIDELKSMNKPFVVILNSLTPKDEKTEILRNELEEKYEVPILPVNVEQMEEPDIENILETVLYDFPLNEIRINISKWVEGLEKNHWIKESIISTLKQCIANLQKIRDIDDIVNGFENLEFLDGVTVENVELGDEIVDIITQSNTNQNVELGKEVLEKYNYKSSITLKEEPIIKNNFSKILKLNFAFISFAMLSFSFFIDLYNDIKDMTDYVYHSSEGREYQMKNKNQEGQMGLLKTELMKMTTVLKEKVALLHSEKIFLNDTISDISHQLKTPMTSLMLLTDLMYNDLDKEKKIEFLDRINAQLSRMDWLIKSMLKLSKLEAKVIDFKTEKVNINELIRRSISPLSVPMELKNISLNINGDKEASYIGDIEWSSEALGNIIKNCIEHTKE